MKNKSMKINQFNPKNKTKKSYKYVTSGGMFSFLGSSKKESEVYKGEETPFKKLNEPDNLHDLKVILNGFYYGYKFIEDINKNNYPDMGLGLSNDLKNKVDVAIITKIGDAYEINYLASEQDISGQKITSKIPVTLQDKEKKRKERHFEVINRPTVTEKDSELKFKVEFSKLKTNIEHVYNGFKAPKKEKSTGMLKRSKLVKVGERENIEIAIIKKENDAYKIEFLKEQPYKEKDDGLENWEFMLNE